MKRLCLTFGVVIFFTGVVIFFTSMAANSNKDSATIHALELPSTKIVSTSGGSHVVRDVLRTLEHETKLAFQVWYGHDSFNNSSILVPKGKHALWDFLGQLSVSNNLIVYQFLGAFTASPSKGTALCYSTSGPLLLVLHTKEETLQIPAKLWLSIHFHPWEVADPEITQLKFIAKNGAQTTTKCELAAEDDGFKAWTISGQHDVQQIERIECLIKAKVRNKLYMVSFPFGKNSQSSADTISAKSLESERLASGMLQQKYEIVWQTGLPKTVETKMSKILRIDLSGNRPSNEDIAWFRQQARSLNRLVAVKIFGVVDQAGKALAPETSGCQDIDLGRIEFRGAAELVAIAGADFRAVLGYEKEESLSIILSNPQRQVPK